MNAALQAASQRNFTRSLWSRPMAAGTAEVTGSMTSLRMAKLGFSCPFVIRL
jgi:hypothetical protein